MKKIQDSFYKNKTWSAKTDSYFEEQLRRTRSTVSKAEYLQIQGCILLESAEPKFQEVGLVLLQRLLDDYPNEYVSIITAQEKLGDYFFKKADFLAAAEKFKIVTDFCNKQHSRAGTSTTADLKWAASLLAIHTPEALSEASAIITAFPVALCKTEQHIFNYNKLAALICAGLEHNKHAADYASAALVSVEKIKRAAVNNLKNEAVKANEIFVERLVKIANP